MPSKDPRIAVLLPSDVKAIFDETAKLMGIPTSKFVRSMLIEASPSIKLLQKPLKTAAKAKKVSASQMFDVVDSMRSDVDKAQIDLEELIASKS